jgi:hypothetical protein
MWQAFFGWTGWPRVLHVAGSITGAVVVAAAFIVVLMTATAQQKVVEALDAQHAADPKSAPVDYSTAWAEMKAAKSAQAQIDHLQKAEDTAKLILQKKQAALTAATGAVNDAWSAFRPEAVIAANAHCPGANPEASTISDQRATWGAIKACMVMQLFSKDVSQEILQNAAGAGDFSTANNAFLHASSELVGAQARVESLEASILPLSPIVQASSQARLAFYEMDFLTDDQSLGGGAFVNIPPFLMQIVLAFFAGMFGALLVTLVLVVYPNNAIGPSVGVNYAARLFLGGLISLGAYILIAGGTAIVGAEAALEDGHANYMTFCAIGVLAGMFSDRAAAWISRRADSFFAGAPQPPGPHTP